MRYFTVRIENSRDVHREVDIPLRQLLPLFQYLESRLREDGIFSAKEELLKRFVPSVDASPDSLEVQIFTQDLSDLGSVDYDIYPNSLGTTLPDLPIKCISLWFCATQTRRICSVSFPAVQLFQSLFKSLYSDLTLGQKGGEQDNYSFKVFLRGSGLPFVPRQHLSRTISLLILENPKAEREIEKQPLTTVLNVLVTERKSLVTTTKRSLRDYKSVLVGVRQRGDLRILVERSASEGIFRYLQQDKHGLERSNKYELGGFLLGNVFLDEDDKPFVDIDKIVPMIVDGMASFTGFLRYEPEALQTTLEEIKGRYPDKNRVGWYHAHLIYKRSSGSIKSSYTFDTSAYDFSKSDKELHLSMFPEMWQVALLVDIQNQKFYFYQLKRNAVEPCSGYYLYSA